MLKFNELELVPELLKGLETIGFTECTSVQAEVIPTALQGKDVSALSQTGTGKTAAFMLPLMDRVFRSLQSNTDPQSFGIWLKGHFCLVLVPTRELAEQVYQDFYKLRGDTGLEAVVVYGGTGYDEQKDRISRGAQFVIGTPGRLIDLYKTHALDLRQVRGLVFDEADRMFDMGFKDDMKFILQRVPKERQILMFSATMNFDVLHTAYRYGSNPVEFNLSKDQVKAENVEDSILHVSQEDKAKFLLSILKKESPRQCIIFSNFKHNVDRYAGFLTKNGVPAMGISSLLTQAQRNRVIQVFKEGNGQNILVATDVAARGLDIKNVDLVINCELPDDPENYIHRIGRTGRAGASGKAISMVSDRDVAAMTRIEDYLKHKLPVGWIDDQELVKEFIPLREDDVAQKPKWDRKEGPPQRPHKGPRPPHAAGSKPQPRPPGPKLSPAKPLDKPIDRSAPPLHAKKRVNGEVTKKKHEARGSKPGAKQIHKKPMKPARPNGVLKRMTNFVKSLFK